MAECREPWPGRCPFKAVWMSHVFLEHFESRNTTLGVADFWHAQVFGWVGSGLSSQFLCCSSASDL